MFLSRFCRNNMPVRNMLRRKGVNTTIICPLCNTNVEHILHVFFDCAFAAQVWQQLNCVFDMSSVEAGHVWLLQKFSTGDNVKIVSISTGLWGIWYERNLRVWENKSLSPSLTVEWSKKQIVEWHGARRK